MINELNELEVITVYVDNLTESKNFYATIFNSKVVYEDEVSWVIKLNNVMLNLLDSKEAIELIEPAIVATKTTSTRVLLTIKVDCVDAVCSALKEHGVGILNGPLDRPWGRRTAAFCDPDNNVWEIAQELT